ncbi:MAG: peptidylprolyl isomerase [Gemmatimonadales bacterium]|nr:peptidylprolyl isomerase [Gemmatimonadales bacterium]
MSPLPFRSAAPLLPIVALALAACGGKPGLEEARAGIVAEAGGAKLAGKDLERDFSKAVPQPTPALGDFLISTWVDYALLAKARQDGFDVLAPENVSKATWTDSIALVLDAQRARNAAARPKLEERILDSVYKATDFRIGQHILFRIPPDAKKPQVDSVRAKLEEAARRLREKEPFAKVATALSEDEESRGNGGILLARARGSYPKPFDNALWDMPSGDIRGPIQTQAGVHIIRRPPLDEVRAPLLAAATLMRNLRADSTWADSLARAQGLKVPPEGIQRARDLASEPFTPADPAAPVATWTGGQLTAGEFRQWLGAFPGEFRGELRAGADARIERVLREVAINRLVLAEATRNRLAAAPEGLAARRKAYTDAVQASQELVALAPAGGDLSAGMRTLFDTLFAGGRPFRPVPSGLSLLLREKYPVTVAKELAGVIVEQAKVARAERDTEQRRKMASAAEDSIARERALPAVVDTGSRRMTGKDAAGGDLLK